MIFRVIPVKGDGEVELGVGGVVVVAQRLHLHPKTKRE